MEAEPRDDDEKEEKVALSAENLFAEKDEALKLIGIITSSSATIDDKDTALAGIRKIFDNYLECPTLLDRYVGVMVTKLMQAARETIMKCCSRGETTGKDDDIDESSTVSFDSCAHPLSAIYALSKVRGRKNVQKFLSHEVEDVEPILRALERVSKKTEEECQEKNPKNREENVFSSNTSDGPQRWESVYVLWNWLGTISLVPFDCSVLLTDSSSIILSLIDLGKMHLSESGPTREAAASCLAAWLVKPDLEIVETPKFVQWSHEILQSSVHGQTRKVDIFLLLGVMQTLVTILKVSTSPREEIMSCMSPLWESCILLAESKVCDSNILLRKLMIKWWSRMGCVYLPPRIASWRYQRGRRSLLENLQRQYDSTAYAATKAHESSSQLSSNAKVSQLAQHDENLLLHVPDHVEDSMGYIIEALSDPSTVVRWSAAKGVGRLSERLPSICADDVLDAVLELFTDPGADRAWHGACLALAELARRGLLLPNRLAEVVPMVARAIQYDLKRGQTSVGAHVRDAACYTYWSFARAYAPSVLKPHVSTLSESIILTCLFDREVNCRRAASASFQECVGRQGADVSSLASHYFVLCEHSLTWDMPFRRTFFTELRF